MERPTRNKQVFTSYSVNSESCSQLSLVSVDLVFFCRYQSVLEISFWTVKDESVMVDVAKVDVVNVDVAVVEVRMLQVFLLT